MIAVIVLVAVIATVSIVTAGLPSIITGATVGSGRLVTQQENFTGFSAVSIASGFRFTITQSSSYSIVVTADDNIINHVQVSQSGNTVYVRLAPGWGYLATSLKVEVAMPDISGLTISGGSTGTVAGFNSSHDLAVTASGGSTASISGSASNLSLDASGGSRLDLANFHVANASANLSGGSGATVNLDGTLDATVSGGSQLYYVGNPTMGSIDSSGGSTIARK